jgi:hypothetical protein
MLTAATSEVMRLVSLVVRRLDSELVESAVRNAESSVLDQHRRWVDEMRTLSELHTIQERVIQESLIQERVIKEGLASFPTPAASAR